MPSSVKRFLSIAVLLCASIFCLLRFPPFPSSGATSDVEWSNIVHSVVVSGRKIDTKSYLDQAWEAKGRPGLFSNGGMNWDPRTREWHLKPNLPKEFTRVIGCYGASTSWAADINNNIAATYHELDLMDELARFYTTFLHSYFTTLGELRRTNSPEIKRKELGPELGPDSTRTMAWWQDTNDGVTLREYYWCNSEFFVPASGLIRLIALLKPAERTAAMTQFVSEYISLIVKEHILRRNTADRMRDQMDSSRPTFKRGNMTSEELDVIVLAVQLLGANAADAKLVVLAADERAKLVDLVKVGVERLQFSRTLTTDSNGRICGSYFNGDFDWQDELEYAGYQGEKFPTPADKAKPKGASWDISHFSVVSAFFRTLYDNRAATGINFPQKADIEYLANQYAYHVFEGDYKRPLFRNFFDGTDGWYRVNYLGRSSYGIAPSHYCNSADPSHSCNAFAGVYRWGLLAAFHPEIARIQLALLDLARSNDPAIACFQPQCFRERYYRTLDFSFSFLDQQGNIQYPPALLVLLSQWVTPPPADIPRP